MNNVLIIFQYVPDDTDLYYLQVDDDTLAKLQLCHSHYLNECDQSREVNDALCWLCNWLDKQPAVYSESPKKLKKGPVFIEGIQVTVIVTGFIL